ncbi:hypothetical protein ES703_112197 [subsurface metagenome]
MLTKTFLKRCGMVGLLAFGILWTQMPVKAQEKSVREQLVEAKAAIADQVWIIEQMKDNFFKVTGQLETEIKKLRAINIEQARKIEEITNVYSRKIQKLGGELDRLKAVNWIHSRLPMLHSRPPIPSRLKPSRRSPIISLR